MRILKWFLGIVVALASVLGLVGMLLPRQVEVKRTVLINAPAADVFPHVSDLKATEAWSPWLGIDPDVKTTYSAATSGVGATMQWASDHPNVGNGKMEVVEVDMGSGPIGRCMGLMMDSWVGADYERGLANLKALVEG